MNGEPVVVTALAAALGVIATAFVTWSVATRATSGRVATTDADRLWAQSDKLIDALTADNTGLRERAAEREAEMETLRHRLNTLEVKAQRAELAESECLERADRFARQVAALERRLSTIPADAPMKATERVTVEGENLATHGPEVAKGDEP